MKPGIRYARAGSEGAVPGDLMTVRDRNAILLHETTAKLSERPKRLSRKEVKPEPEIKPGPEIKQEPFTILGYFGLDG